MRVLQYDENSLKNIRIRDRALFDKCVFGSEHLLRYYPELATTGVIVSLRKVVGTDHEYDVWQIIGADESSFFSQPEVDLCMILED